MCSVGAEARHGCSIPTSERQSVEVQGAHAGSCKNLSQRDDQGWSSGLLFVNHGSAVLHILIYLFSSHSHSAVFSNLGAFFSIIFLGVGVPEALLPCLLHPSPFYVCRRCCAKAIYRKHLVCVL